MKQKLTVRKPKERGGFLTVMLSISFLAILASLPLLFNQQIIQKVSETVSAGYMLWVIISVGIHTMILIGIIQWRKIAVYGLFLFYIVVMLTNSIALRHEYTLHIAVGLCLWFWAIKRKWYLFT